MRRPKSYTWQLNNSISNDPNLDYYKQQHAMYEQLSEDIKDLRADMKRTGDKLAKAHPNSESIKYGFTIAVMEAASSKKEHGTRLFWDTLTPEEQELAFSNISRKLQAGEFVHYDPIRAIKENLRTTSRDQPQPEWLRGDEKDLDIVQVLHEGRYRLCTRETMTTFNLQYVMDWN